MTSLAGFLIAAAIDKYVYIGFTTICADLIVKYSRLERVSDASKSSIRSVKLRMLDMDGAAELASDGRYSASMAWVIR